MTESLFPNAPRQVSVAGQIAEVQREINMRAHVYPRWITEKRISQPEADARSAGMVAVLATLLDLAKMRRALETIAEGAADPAVIARRALNREA